MNSFYCENQGTHTYMVYEVGSDEIIDSLSLGMMVNNQIRGISPIVFTQMDQVKSFKYNVSAKVSLSQYLAGSLSRDKIIKIFLSIADAVLVAEEYMIDRSSFLFHTNYIFVNVSTADTEIICLPLVGLPQPDISGFFKNIMFNPNTTFDSTENLDYVAKIINHLNSATTFSLSNFKELLISLQKSQPQAVSHSVNASTIMGNQGSMASQQAVLPRQMQSQPVQPRQIQQQPVQQQVVQVQQQQVRQTVVIPPNDDSQNKNMNQHQTTAEPEANEKPMSMLYLLRNYSKENAEIYKAQKQAKKEKADLESAKPSKKKKKEKKVAGGGFMIPGQEDYIEPEPQKTFVSPEMVKSQVQQPVVEQTVQQQPVQQQNVVSNQGTQYQFVANNVSFANTTQGNFGETTVLNVGTIGETTVLSQLQNPQQPVITPHLIRMKNGEKVMLNKPNFRVGKERSYVDYFIGDNTAISRSHANFIIRDAEYYVMDMNSTNHTFVNGQMIQSNVETPITHGDKIRLANEDFEFKLY